MRPSMPRGGRTKEIPATERPRPGQILAMTLLVLLAWLPLIPIIESRVSLFIACLVALRLVSLRWPFLAPGRWLLFPLTLAGIAIAFSAYFTFFGYAGGTALLATMSALKLLEMNRIRDIRFATVLYGFLLVAQFLFAQSALLGLYLALLLVLDFALMTDLTARRGHGRGALVAAVRSAGTLTLQSLPLVVVLFFLFPRLSAPLWSLPQPQDRGRTGMSDWMQPGSLNQLVLSGEPAFRIRFDGPLPSTDKLYWRGPVVWRTDGRRWSGWPLDTPGNRIARVVEAGEVIDYSVELEATDDRWLFVLDLPLVVPSDARIRGDFHVVTALPVKTRRIYHATSALRYNSGELGLEQELAGTQLPDDITRRMRNLVTGWQQEVAGDPAALVQRALRHINEEPFYYSLSPPRLGANPMDSFLFSTRSGYCEHYAGAFALLMRIADIPSRIVLGYMGGEYNPLGDYLLVRQSDAHAWVEVWLAGQGWVRIDPTAAIAPERVEPNALLAALGAGAPVRMRPEDVGVLTRWIHHLGLIGDAIETGWRNWILGLTLERQQQMLQTMGLGHLREYGLAAALILGAGVVVALLLGALTRTSGPRDEVERIYARFCKRLAAIGLERRAGEGPRDYSRRVTTARPDLRPAVESFMMLYLPLRYGAADPSQDPRDLSARLRRLRPRRRYPARKEMRT